MAVCIGNWINKHNYPYGLNFIYSCIHVVDLGCEIFVFDL